MTVKSEDIGDRLLVGPAVVPAERVLDEEGALMESAQAERAEVDVPFAVVDLDEADIFLAQGLVEGMQLMRMSLGALTDQPGKRDLRFSPELGPPALQEAAGDAEIVGHLVDRAPRLNQSDRVFLELRGETAGVATAPYFNAISSIDTRADRVRVYRYGTDVMAEEHRFVPRPGSGNPATGG